MMGSTSHHKVDASENGHIFLNISKCDLTIVNGKSLNLIRRNSLVTGFI